ncbi:MAG: hypothetical protein ACJA0Q_000626 [Saprospiraceae bacterium]|jgi:hypothetical protein
MTPFFQKLWNNYQAVTPTAKLVRDSLNLDSYDYFNDHVAFRSLNLKGYGIDCLIQPFIKEGYKQCGEYYFEEKKLNAVHLESTTNPLLPKVFISEIILEEFSTHLQNTLTNSFKHINTNKVSEDILTFGRNWQYAQQIYLDLSKESEYAAWIYAHGYRVNHFTIRINSLDNTHINSLCKHLIKDDVSLNESGGIIKGSKQVGLRQASTLADNIKVHCDISQKTFEIPSCYVEFAERFEVNGKQFNGFVAKSANHIFDSTNQNKQQ